MVDVSKLKRGDKVRFLNQEKHISIPRYYPPAGTVGTVIRDGDDLIQWPNGTTGGDGRWFAGSRNLELARTFKAHKIVIMLDKDDDMKVIAKDLDSGKTGKAKCSPSDTFDFYTGAKLALSRLCGEGKPKEPAKCKFKVGDIIIGNANADRYRITREGWVGKVVEVFKEHREGVGCDEGKPLTFKAARVNVEPEMEPAFNLCDDAFDLA